MVNKKYNIYFQIRYLFYDEMFFGKYANDIFYDDIDDLNYIKETFVDYLIEKHINIKEKQIKKIMENYIEEYLFIFDDILNLFNKKLFNKLKIKTNSNFFF